MKTCFKCGVAKDPEEFYRHPEMADGRLGKCRECTKLDVRTNYAAKRAQYSTYDQERRQRSKRKLDQIENLRRHRLRHPERAAARTAVSNAIRDGRLIRQPCEVCGSVKAQAHHDDYTKPLDVRWLCFKDHREKEHGQVVTAA